MAGIDAIGCVAAYLNSSFHSLIGDTPHYIVYVQGKGLPYSVLLYKDDLVHNVVDYMRLRISDFRKTCKPVQHTITESEQIMNKQQSKTAAHHSQNFRS